MEKLFASDIALLRDSLALLITEQECEVTSSLRGDLLSLLQAPGKLLSPVSPSLRIPQGFWALLPYTIARYCLPDAEPAVLLRVAISCEMLACALDYFDEIEDDDQSPERQTLGDGRLLNAAYALTILARRAISTIPTALIQPGLRERLLDMVDQELLVAVQGQHEDLLVEKREHADVSAEECLTIATAKAGSLVRLVCRLATMAVGASPEVSDRFASIGEYIGTAFQIENDTHDLEMLLFSSGASGKSDLVRAKKTLPMIFAAQQHATLQQSPLSADDKTQEPQQDISLESRAYEDAIAASLGCAVYLRKEARIQVRSIEDLQGKPLPQTISALLGIETF